MHYNTINQLDNLETLLIKNKGRQYWKKDICTLF